MGEAFSGNKVRLLELVRGEEIYLGARANDLELEEDDALIIEGSAQDIDAFIHDHRPLDNSVQLADAEFWSPTQREFLREALEQDSDWSEVIDQLDTRLR